jgi:hypothetical protein
LGAQYESRFIGEQAQFKQMRDNAIEGRSQPRPIRPAAESTEGNDTGKNTHSGQDPKSFGPEFNFIHSR